MPTITDYSSLKQEVSSELSRSGVGDVAGRIPRWIQQAERRLFSLLRVSEMETTANVTVVISTQTSALPTRFLEARNLYISGSAPLEFRQLQELWHVYANLPTAAPLYYSIANGNFVWAPLPDAGPTVICEHYAEPAELSADTDTNTVLTHYPDTYLYGACLAAAVSLANGGLIQGYAQLFENAIADAQNNDRSKIASGDAIPPARMAQVVG